jgi:hypothetical protein
VLDVTSTVPGMYRIVGAFCLALVVVGVIYLTQNRARDRQTQSYSEGVKKGASETVTQKRRSDSLAAVWEAERKAYRDSLSLVRAQSDSVVDSLSIRLAQQDQQIQKFAAELKKRPKAKAVTTAAAGTQAPNSRHQEILTYYKKRYETLPKDLSEYEMRVALTEIREETATKYSISLSELETIRRKSGLTF